MKKIFLAAVILFAAFPAAAKFSPHERFYDFFYTEDTTFEFEYNFLYNNFRAENYGAAFSYTPNSLNLTQNGSNNWHSAHEFSASMKNFYSISLMVNYFSSYLADLTADKKRRSVDHWNTAFLFDIYDFGDESKNRIIGASVEMAFYKISDPTSVYTLIDDYSGTDYPTNEKVKQSYYNFFLYYTMSMNKNRALKGLFFTVRLGVHLYRGKLLFPYVNIQNTSYDLYFANMKVENIGPVVGTTLYYLMGSFIVFVDFDYTIAKGKGKNFEVSEVAHSEAMRFEAGLGFQLSKHYRILVTIFGDVSKVEAVASNKYDFTEVASGYTGFKVGLTVIW